MRCCSICKAPVEGDAPSVLTMGGYGNPRFVCEDCDKEIEKMLLSKEPSEVQAAMQTLAGHLERIGCEDNAVIATMEQMMARANERAVAIKEGRYDFSLDEPDAEEEELVEIPEELRETEEDRALDEQEEKVAEKWDKVMNWVWYVFIALFGAAFIYLIVSRFI